MGKLIKCKACGADVSKKAKQCPQCAEPMGRTQFKLSHLIVLLAFGAYMYSLLNPVPEVVKVAPSLPTTKEAVAAKTKTLLNELKAIPVSDFKENLKRYEVLARMHRSEEKYSEKVAFYKKKQERQETIEGQFSGWNGEHRSLSRHIEKNLKNPDSYEHVKTLYVDKGDHLLLETTYRGTNSFGAIVTNKAYAKVGLDGAGLTIIQ